VSESENFLARWSRRKRAAEQGASDTPAAADVANAAAPPSPSPAPDAAPAETSQADASPVDLEALPPIDSITADTDIRAFLAPGIPAQLTRAALRRVWETDPAIRDFVGLAENAWDFNAPGGVPGFGPALPLEEAQRLAKAIMGDDQSAPAAAASDPGEPSQMPDVSASTVGPPEVPAAAPAAPPEEVAGVPADQASPDVAAQDDAAEERPTAVARLHGGALPR
jgi:hypothetical protein